MELTGQAKEPQNPPDPLWFRVLNSSALVTLLTVLIGGVMVQWINFRAQEAIKDRELKNTLLQEKGKLALSAYKGYFEQKNKIIERVLTEVGSITSASENLISLTKPEWRRKFFGAKAFNEVRRQKTEIRDHYNKADELWTKDQDALGFLLEYYVGELEGRGQQDTIAPDWMRLRSSVVGYKDCARKRYIAMMTGTNARSDCADRRQALTNNLTQLSSDLRKSRFYFWTEWDKGLRQ